MKSKKRKRKLLKLTTLFFFHRALEKEEGTEEKSLWSFKSFRSLKK
jgi:hypothetical protein